MIPSREIRGSVRTALVVVEVARAEFEDPPAIHVALAHQRPQLGDHRLAALARDDHDLERKGLAHAAVQRLEHHDERARLLAHEPEAGLHARDALVLAERHGRVLDGAWLEPHDPLLAAHQLGQPRAVALDDRQADDLMVAPGAPRVDRDLEGRPVPGGERPRDDRQLARIAPEVLAQAPTHRRLVLLGPLPQPLQRTGELLWLHGTGSCQSITARRGR